MSRPLRIQYPDAYYHVTCRGNEQRKIFLDSEDREAFFRLLARSVDIFEIRLLSYAVAADLKAHRTDTEAHKKVYKVKED